MWNANNVQLAPSGGALLAKMAGYQTGLSGWAEKMVQMRPQGGTKQTKNVNMAKGFLPN